MLCHDGLAAWVWLTTIAAQNGPQVGESVFMFREIQGKLRWKYFRVEKHEFSRYRFFFDYWKVPRVRGGLQCKNGLGASRCEMQLSLKRKTCWLIDVQITEFYPVLSETITLQLLVVGFHILV